MADRFVIRRTGKSSPWLKKHWGDKPDYDEMVKRDAEFAGHYEKLGGGLTTDLSEAVVVGWTKSVRRRWVEVDEDSPRWGVYELVPVQITVLS